MSEYYQGKPYPTPVVCRETGDIIDPALCTECESFRDWECQGDEPTALIPNPPEDIYSQIPEWAISPSGPGAEERTRATYKIVARIDEIVGQLYDLRNAITGDDVPF